MADEIVIIGAADDACRTRAVEDSIHRRGCSCGVYLISDEVALWRDSHFLQAIDGCRMVVLVFSQVANSYASVRAGVSTAFRKRKKILPFRLDMTPYCPELDYCLGPAQHIDASTDAGAALIQLERAVESILHPPSHKRKSHGRLKWIAGLVVAVCAIVAWKVWGPGGRIGFVRAFEPILEEAIDAICEDYAGEIVDGFAQVVMLDVVTGDYVAHERAFKDGRFSVLPGSLARKNAVLKPYETDRLIIPILAATAMKQAGVTRSVALGEKDWAKSGMLGWSKMLEDEPLEKGLSALHMTTTLHGSGVAAEARRFLVCPYHLLRALIGIVGEAHGMPGFDFCGGRDNAVGILSRMERDDGMGGANAVLCEVRGDASGNGRKTCNVAGAVCMESPCCMLFVRIEAKERAEFDVGESAYGLWNTLALLATAADRKWGGNGR